MNTIGRTPLYRAARYGPLEIVKYLIEKGADFSVNIEYGITPFHEAVEGGNLDIVKYLMEKGFNLKATENGTGA